jgi:hypothetical protein
MPKKALPGGALSGGSVLHSCNMLYIGNPLEVIVKDFGTKLMEPGVQFVNKRAYSLAKGHQ